MFICHFLFIDFIKLISISKFLDHIKFYFQLSLLPWTSYISVFQLFCMLHKRSFQKITINHVKLILNEIGTVGRLRFENFTFIFLTLLQASNWILNITILLGNGVWNLRLLITRRVGGLGKNRYRWQLDHALWPFHYALVWHSKIRYRFRLRVVALCFFIHLYRIDDSFTLRWITFLILLWSL